MEPRPLRTEADHKAALAEIEGLLNAAPDTLRGDRLDLMTLLAEAYEVPPHEVPPPIPSPPLNTP